MSCRGKDYQEYARFLSDRFIDPEGELLWKVILIILRTTMGWIPE